MGCSASRLPSERSISRPRAPKKPSRLASGSSGGSDDSGGDGGSAPAGAPAAEPGIQEGAPGSPATLQSMENRPAPGSLPAASAAGAKSATSGKRRVSFVDEGNEPTPIALESSAAHAPPPMPPPPPTPQLVGKLAQYELLERIGDGTPVDHERGWRPRIYSTGVNAPGPDGRRLSFCPMGRCRPACCMRVGLRLGRTDARPCSSYRDSRAAAQGAVPLAALPGGGGIYC